MGAITLHGPHPGVDGEVATKHELAVSRRFNQAMNWLWCTLTNSMKVDHDKLGARRSELGIELGG